MLTYFKKFRILYILIMRYNKSGNFRSIEILHLALSSGICLCDSLKYYKKCT